MIIKHHTIYLLAVLMAMSFVFSSCQGTKNASGTEAGEHTNHLAGSTSPYLLQHANNPVDWYPWGEEALEKAREENKMLIISIGYAACHWCHVMEHESFEDSTVAALMNEHFVNIKVDREERPDIDEVYMTACQLASRQGCGWPLNAFALSDGRPVWAGTYFPKNDWLTILREFVRLQDEKPDQLVEFADNLAKGFDQIQSIEPSSGSQDLSAEILDEQISVFKEMLDMKYGGRKGAPKFPMPNNYEWLMRYAFENDDRELDTQVRQTLLAIANGGIYDHVGGGFARYSTDQEWHVPHFEKMLYDNGQLLKLYALGYKRYGDELFAERMLETVEWLKRDMLDKTGGMYSSLDADSEGEEGKFYVWAYDEVKSESPNEEVFDMFKWQYDLKERGNWEEGKNVLTLQYTDEEAAQKFGVSREEAEANRKTILSALFNARQERPRPGLDDKIITSWNALTADGLLEAFEAIGAAEYKEMGLRIVDFLMDRMTEKDGRMYRTYAKGERKINAFLDDYATTIQALVHAYEVTFEEKYLMHADKLATYAMAHFSEDDNPILYYTSDLDPPLVTRQKDWNDNVIPSSNSIMARGLFDLGLYLYKEEYKERASSMLETVLPQMTESAQPPYYSNWYILFMDLINTPYEVAVLGSKSHEFTAEMHKKYLPGCRFLGGEDEGSLELLKDKLVEGDTYIYVCQNKVCKLPVTEVSKALELIN